MELARAAWPQIRVPQAPAEVRNDGVGYFFECTTQGKYKVCEKNARIMCIKCNVHLHNDDALKCNDQTLPFAENCTMNLRDLIAVIVLHGNKQLWIGFNSLCWKLPMFPFGNIVVSHKQKLFVP